MHNERKIRETEYVNGRLHRELLFSGPRGLEFQTTFNSYDDNENIKLKELYKGQRSAERLVSREYFRLKNPYTSLYEGEKGMERKIQSVYVGHNVYFEGPKSYERKVRIEMYHPKRQTQFFQGIKNHEHMIKTIEPLINKTCFFEGPNKEERRVRCEYSDRIEYYDGPAFDEKLVRTEMLIS